jgi:hypothetical protein
MYVNECNKIYKSFSVHTFHFLKIHTYVDTQVRTLALVVVHT